MDDYMFAQVMRRLEYMMPVTRDNEMRAEGRAEGRSEERLNSIRKIMDNLKTSADNAMDILGIPASERQDYLMLL